MIDMLVVRYTVFISLVVCVCVCPSKTSLLELIMDIRTDALSGSDHLIPLQSVQLMIINLVYVVVAVVTVAV